MPYSIFTIVTRILPGKLQNVKSLLDQIGLDPAGNARLPFAKLESLHFASLTIFDENSASPYLVFEHNIDGFTTPYLNDLIAKLSPGLHEIYKNCADYNASDSSAKETILMYLKDHLVHPSAYHIGTPGRSQLRINSERTLHTLIQDHLDSQTEWSNLESLSKSIQAFVDATSDKWSAKTLPRISKAEWIYARRRTWLLLALILILGYFLNQNYGLIWIPFAAVAVFSFVITWSAILWHKNATDIFIPSPVRHEHIEQISVREDNASFVQNHFANIIDVKPGWFRRWNLKLVFLIASVTTPWSDKGELSGIPSIHFAHWALIDGGRKLLFLSNYDGSWENYLDDFIDKASVGLTGIWSNTVDFPPTKHFTDEGSRNGPLFKQYVRDRQSYSPVWYSAYQRLSVQNIDRNTEIAQGFAACLGGKKLKSWFQKL